MRKKLNIPSVSVAKTDRLLCEFLCDFVRSHDFELIGPAVNGIEAAALLNDRSPDLMIVGADLDGIRGIDLAAYINQENLATRLILFSRDKSSELVSKAEQFHVAGLLFADDGLQELRKCLESVVRGQTYRSPQAVAVLCSAAPANGAMCFKYYAALLLLSKTELKIIWWTSQHLSIKEISEKLFISGRTVINHQASIRQKLNLKGHGALVKFALSVKDELVHADGVVWLRPR